MNTSSPFTPDPSLLNGSKFHDNVTQTYIRTTEDKLRNLLRDFKEAYAIIHSWNVPCSLAVAFGSTLVTSTFRPCFGRTADFWEAFFTLLFIAAVVWAILTGIRAYRLRKEGHLETLINKIKNCSEEPG